MRLLRKNGSAFWKCWKSKFKHQNGCSQVDGCADVKSVAVKFTQHFSTTYLCRADALLEEYSIGANLAGAVGANAPKGKGSVGACTQRKSLMYLLFIRCIF